MGAGNGSGSGSATITFWVNGNDTTATRTGTIITAEQTITITQSGTICSYNISPANRWFTADGGSAFINIAAGDACSWTVTSIRTRAEQETIIRWDEESDLADFYTASLENMNSRVWVGVHFRQACQDGRAMGHEIGELVAGLLPRRED